MNKIKLGRSGVEAPQIGLGCMRIAGLSAAQGEKLIRTAMENGINFFDHADIYGGGECESFFAKVFPMNADLREKVILQTKCGIRQGCFDFSKEHILASVDASLARLKTEYVDFLLLHRPDTLMEPEEVAEAFCTLRKAGKVRYFGVSNQNPGQMALLNKYCGDAYVRDVRFNHIDRVWMVWDGCRWTEDQTGQVKRLADELLQQLVRDAETLPNREELLKHVRRTRSSKAKEAMLHEAQHLPGIPILPNELDRYKDALNVRNGILDLKTGQLRPHDRKLCFSMLADAEYLPDAVCPRWLGFLDDVTGGDKALQRYIQRMVGYFLTGSTREQCIFFLYGSGSNGKSTFVNTIASLFGDYTKNAQAETIMRNDRGGGSGARSDLARLKGVRLTTTSEPSGGCVLDEALVKTMTGDDVITARRLYKEEFEFRPEFKILMATNYKPIIKHSDYGIWRRIRLLPFTVQIPPEKKDPQLGDKLREEKAGIFRWAVQGAIDWYREGLPPCPCIDRANEEYRLEMDKMQQFVGDCLTREPGSTLPSARLYDVYRAWCTEHGERFPLSQVRFSGELQDNYHFQRRKNRTCNEFLDAALTETGQELALAAPETFR